MPAPDGENRILNDSMYNISQVSMRESKDKSNGNLSQRGVEKSRFSSVMNCSSIQDGGSSIQDGDGSVAQDSERDNQDDVENQSMRSGQDRKSDEKNNGDNTPHKLLNALVNILDKQMKQGQEPAGRLDEEAKNINPFEEEKVAPNNNIEEEKVDRRR